MAHRPSRHFRLVRARRALPGRVVREAAAQAARDRVGEVVDDRLLRLVVDVAARVRGEHARDRVEAAVAAFFDAIIERLAADGRVELRGFGAFTTRARDPRAGRNPRTGELVDVSAKRVPFFKPGKELKERVDQR